MLAGGVKFPDGHHSDQASMPHVRDSAYDDGARDREGVQLFLVCRTAKTADTSQESRRLRLRNEKPDNSRLTAQ